MSAGCARCGHCCDPVYLKAGDFDRMHATAGTPDETKNARFITEHWHGDGVPDEDGWLDLVCDVFDPVHRVCGAYDDRPPVCRDHPWYGEDPAQRAGMLAPQCSYLLDVPPALRPEGSRPLIPLAVAGSTR